MGIKYFYTWLNTYCKDSIITSLQSFLKPSINNLYIDLNGVIHETAQETYRYGKYKHIFRLGFAIPVPSVETFCINLIRNIETIIHDIGPTNIVYISMDGIAPKSKRREQKNRRARNTIGGMWNFDSNNITSGTKFLNVVSNILKTTEWQHKNVIIDDEKNSGEGEHKIFKRIKSEQHEINAINRCIYGIDSDIIMLSLLLTDMNNVYVNRNLESIVTVDGLKSILNIPSNDFVILLFLLGNDHVPSISNLLNYQLDSINMLIDTYKKLTAIEKGQNQNGFYLVHNRVIDFNNFNILLRQLLNCEFKLAPQILAPAAPTCNEIKEPRDETKIYAYLKTLQWIYNYYYSFDVPEWNWYYSYDTAPNLQELIDYIDKNSNELKITFHSDQPCDLKEALFEILPETSYDII